MPAWSHERLMEVLADALELPAGERGAFLERACGGDAGLRAEVERLLAAEAATDPFPTLRAEDLLVGASAAPAAIGPYRVVREIGRGGMGVVYLAEQQRPVRRQVAVKVIQLGMNSAEVLARFEAERQALAMMNHPGVAAMYDAGVTDAGRPYFVMEYVAGVPITEYCDAHRLDTAGRIDLFVRVCEAVQHAHQKAIIHRDLKPGNVLVTGADGRPAPKVIDFGVAKALEQRLTERTVFTEHGQLIGTPEYMSPEQASLGGVDVDTRSDVYSLGVLLYELLTGALPFDRTALRESAFDEIRRIIREVDPPRPSTRLSGLGPLTNDLAAARRDDPAGHRRSLRGELDWITMRALEKDRARRYASPADLAADLARHLRGEPVAAGPPSKVYRARKFVRRHRVPVAAAGVVAASLVAGLAATIWQARAAHAERARAEARAADVRKLAGTLIFDIDDAIQSAGPTKAREQLVETARKFLETLEAESPDDAGRVELINGYLKLGNVQYYPGYPHLGQPAAAADSYAKALALARERSAARPGDSSARADVGRACIYLARAQAGQNRFDDALGTLEEARSIYESLAKAEPAVWRWPRNVAMTLDHAADIYQQRGQGTKTLGAMRQVQTIYERLAAQFPQETTLRRDVMVVHSGLAVVLMNCGLPCDAVEHARRSRAITLEQLEREPANPQFRRDAFNETHLLVHGLLTVGLAGEPLRLMEGMIDRCRKVAAEDPSSYSARRDLAVALRDLGDALHANGRISDAIAAQIESLKLEEGLLKLDADDQFIQNEAANVCRSLALMHLDCGRVAEAAEYAGRAVRMHRDLAGRRAAAKLSVSNSQRVLAEVLLAQDNAAAAIENLRAAAEAYAVPADVETPPAAERREYVYVLADLGEALRRAGQPAAAAATLAEARSLADALLKLGQGDHAIACWRVDVLLSQARLALAGNDAPAAAATAAEALAGARKLVALDADSFAFRVRLARALELTADAAAAAEDPAAAQAAAAEALGCWKAARTASPEYAATAGAIAALEARAATRR